MKHMYKEMKHLSILSLLILQLFTFTSCVEEEEYANTPTGNFEALWRIMDEHYCFFDLKQKELGVDWNNVHARYASQVSDKMTNDQLFVNLDTNMHGEERAYVVTGQYEKVCPLDIYPQLLVKAAITDDIDKMEELGIYEVVEEDLSLCEFVCTSKVNVQQIIRHGLDLVRKEME